VNSVWIFREWVNSRLCESLSLSLSLSLSALGHMCWYAKLLDCTAAACVDCVFYANMLGEVLKQTKLLPGKNIRNVLIKIAHDHK